MRVAAYMKALKRVSDAMLVRTQKPFMTVARQQANLARKVKAMPM
jgi:hypothetical protein